MHHLVWMNTTMSAVGGCSSKLAESIDYGISQERVCCRCCRQALSRRANDTEANTPSGVDEHNNKYSGQ